MAVHAAITSIQFRLFDNDEDTDKLIQHMKADFDAVVTAQLLDDGTARLSACKGHMSPENFRLMMVKLKLLGVEEAWYRHKDKVIRVDLAHY